MGTTGEHLVSIPVTEGLNGFLGQFTAPDFGAFLNPAVYTIGITMAVVASLETLLCVEATDKLDPTSELPRQIENYSRKEREI